MTNTLDALRERMGTYLMVNRPDARFSEMNRVALCGIVTAYQQPLRDHLVRNTPQITKPTTRFEYGAALLDKAANP